MIEHGIEVLKVIFLGIVEGDYRVAPHQQHRPHAFGGEFYR